MGKWFREYVYIPLGGNRNGNVYLNLFIVFLLTGIWHGANWTYVIWGIVNGIIVVTERMIQNKKWYYKIPKVIKWIITCGIIYFSWILFMSTSVSEALNYYKTIFRGSSLVEINFTWKYFATFKIVVLLIIAFIGSVIGFWKSYLDRYLNMINNSGLVIVKRSIYLVIFAISILFMINSTYSPFIYFQF